MSANVYKIYRMCTKPPVYRAIDLFRCAIQNCSTHSKKQTPPISALMLHYIRSCSSWFIHDLHSSPDPILLQEGRESTQRRWICRIWTRWSSHEASKSVWSLPFAPHHLIQYKKRGMGHPQPSSSSAHLSDSLPVTSTPLPIQIGQLTNIDPQT